MDTAFGHLLAVMALSIGAVVGSFLGPPCMSPLGLELAVNEYSLTFELAASSGDANDIRMNGPRSWRPVNVSGSFLEINISQPVLLTGLQVQGDPQQTGQISGWLLDTSQDCETYRTENYSLDPLSPVYTQTVHLKSVQFVSCIRLRPTHFKGKSPALRLELLGCVIEDSSVCDRDVHPVSEVSIESGGRQLNFLHEIVISWVKILLDLEAYGDTGDAGIFYSRSCDPWHYYEPDDTSVISVTSPDQTSSWMTIDLDKPVRAKCLRIFPPFSTTLKEVHTSGYSSHVTTSLHEIPRNNKTKVYETDITAYQEDAPNVSHDQMAVGDPPTTVQLIASTTLVSTLGMGMTAVHQPENDTASIQSDNHSPFIHPENDSSITDSEINSSVIQLENNTSSVTHTVANSSTIHSEGNDSSIRTERNRSATSDWWRSNCGIKGGVSGYRKKRVVSGQRNVPGEWPWLVSMHFLPPINFTELSGFKHVCGASLIAPSWILTAAHCFDDVLHDGLSDVSEWRIYLGMHDLAREDDQNFVQERLIDTLYVHPTYNLSINELLYDIALVKLNETVDYSDRVSPVCLDDNSIHYGEIPCYVSGWGQLSHGSPGARFPHTASVSILSPASCQRKYDMLPEGHLWKNYIRIEPPELCADVGTNGEDACQGDSGGPLMCQHDGHWYQAGIVSYGYLCGNLATPGLYSRVSYFFDWIIETVEDHDGI